MKSPLIDRITSLIIAIALAMGLNACDWQQPAPHQVEYSQFFEEIEQGHVTRVTMQGRILEATTTEGKRIATVAPPDMWVVSDLLKKGVSITNKQEAEPFFSINNLLPCFFMALVMVIPLLIVIGALIFVIVRNKK